MVGPNVSKTGYGLRKRGGLTTQARLPVEGEIGNLVRACVSARPSNGWLCAETGNVNLWCHAVALALENGNCDSDVHKLTARAI